MSQIHAEMRIYNCRNVAMHCPGSHRNVKWAPKSKFRTIVSRYTPLCFKQMRQIHAEMRIYNCRNVANTVQFQGNCMKLAPKSQFTRMLFIIVCFNIPPLIAFKITPFYENLDCTANMTVSII